MSRLLGIITYMQHGVFQSRVIAGIREIATHHDYELIIDSREEAPQSNNPTTLDILKLAGVLVVANPVPDDFLRQIYLMGKPISLISHLIDDTPIPCVLSNNQQGIAKLVKHLIVHCKRRKFVFIAGNLSQRDGIERQIAFQREMMRYNVFVPETHFLRGDFEPHIAAQSLQKLLLQNPDFDAIVVSDYLMANATIKVLAEHGIKVPQDVAVVGFGDGPEAAATGLTTVAADIVELGRRSARQLLGQIQGLSIRGATVLSVELIVRQTCCN